VPLIVREAIQHLPQSRLRVVELVLVIGMIPLLLKMVALVVVLESLKA
jgi:hypothetical protein